MPLLIIIGFCLWVWVELAALVAIGGELGVLLTIAGIFVTAMVGIWRNHITPEISRRAQRRLDRWFPIKIGRAHV